MLEFDETLCYPSIATAKSGATLQQAKEGVVGVSSTRPSSPATSGSVNEVSYDFTRTGSTSAGVRQYSRCSWTDLRVAFSAQRGCQSTSPTE